MDPNSIEIMKDIVAELQIIRVVLAVIMGSVLMLLLTRMMEKK